MCYIDKQEKKTKKGGETMSNPKILRGTIKEKVVLREGESLMNFNGGFYDEVAWILEAEDGRTYISYSSSADFNFCPLYGSYEDCFNCNWWWERWLRWCGEDCTEEEINNLHPCQNPDLTIIETPERIFWARLLED